MTWNRDVDMIIQINYIIKNYIYKTFNVERVIIFDTIVFNQLYYQKNRICHVVDFQIHFDCTICSWLDHFFVIIFLSMSMSYNWYRNFNETFFFNLNFFKKQRDVSIHRATNSFLEYFDENSHIWLIRILIYARLKTSWLFVHWFDLFLKNLDKILNDHDIFMNYTCFANKLSLRKLIKFYEIFCDHHNE